LSKRDSGGLGVLSPEKAALCLAGGKKKGKNGVLKFVEREILPTPKRSEGSSECREKKGRIPLRFLRPRGSRSLGCSGTPS